MYVLLLFVCTYAWVPTIPTEVINYWDNLNLGFSCYEEWTVSDLPLLFRYRHLGPKLMLGYLSNIFIFGGNLT